MVIPATKNQLSNGLKEAQEEIKMLNKIVELLEENLDSNEKELHKIRTSTKTLQEDTAIASQKVKNLSKEQNGQKGLLDKLQRDSEELKKKSFSCNNSSKDSQVLNNLKEEIKAAQEELLKIQDKNKKRMQSAQDDYIKTLKMDLEKLKSISSI